MTICTMHFLASHITFGILGAFVNSIGQKSYYSYNSDTSSKRAQPCRAAHSSLTGFIPEFEISLIAYWIRGPTQLMT
jgi:hypothetical protein